MSDYLSSLKRAPAWHKYRMSALIAGRNLLAYPTELLAPMVSYGLFVFIFSRIWAVAFATTPLIAGYSQAMCTWYFVVAEGAVFTAGGVFMTLSQDVRDGQIAYSLGRPYHFVAFQFFQRLGPAILQAAGFTVIGLVIGGLSVGFTLQMHPLQFLLLVLSFTLAVSLQFLCQTSLALTALWFEENTAFYWIWQKLALVLGTLMPIEFLPDHWQSVLYYLPWPWLTWAPAWIAVHDNTGRSIQMLAMQLVWLGLALWLTGFIFKRGVRKCTVQGG